MPLRYADRRSRGRGFRAPVLAVLGCACSESRRVARRMPWRCVDRQPSAVRPSPVPQNPSLHPPSPQCRRSTNNIDTRTLRSATLGSTLPHLPHLHLPRGDEAHHRRQAAVATVASVAAETYDCGAKASATKSEMDPSTMQTIPTTHMGCLNTDTCRCVGFLELAFIETLEFVMGGGVWPVVGSR